MSCALTTGYSLPCRDSVGGVKRFYLMEWDSADTLNISGGTVIGWTGYATFRKYEQEEETSVYSEAIQTSRTNGTQFYEQDLTAVLYKGQASIRNEIYLLAQNRLFIIVRDENDKYWLMGRQHGAMLEPSTFSTGTARGDRNGYELKFKAKEPLPAEEIDSSLVTTLGLT